MAIYVDDTVIFAKNKNSITDIENLLKSQYIITNLGTVSHLLGIEINQTENGITLHQGRMIQDTLLRYGMQNCTPAKTPIDANEQFTNKEEITKDEKDYMRDRNLIGSLLYIARNTRPDILYVITKLAQFVNNARKLHWNAAKRVMRYLNGTKEMALHYEYLDEVDKCNFRFYSDSDWANGPIDRKSVAGMAVFLGKSLID